MIKNLFLVLSFSLSPIAAYASSCSECKTSCGCESKKACDCDKEKCDCSKCAEKKKSDKKK